MMSQEDARLSYYRQKDFEKRYQKEIKEDPQIPKEYKEPESVVGQIAEGIKYGYRATVIPAIGYMAEATGQQAGSQRMIKWGSEFGDKATINLLKHPELFRPKEIETFFGGGYKHPSFYGRIIGETIPFIVSTIGMSVAGGILGGPAGAGIGGYASVYALEKGNAYKSMLDNGIAPDKAAVASDIYGVIASAIENSFGISPVKIGQRVFSQNAKMIAVKSFKEYLAKELPRLSITTLKTALTEGSEELAQSFSEKVITKWMDENTEVFTKDMLEEFVAGFVGSIPFGAAEIRKPNIVKMTEGGDIIKEEEKPIKALELQKMAEKEIEEKKAIVPEKKELIEEKPREKELPEIKAIESEEIIKEIPEKIQDMASEDWTENYAPKYEEIYNKAADIQKQIKEVGAKEKPPLQIKLDEFNSQLGKMEDEFIKKWQESAEKEVEKPKEVVTPEKEEKAPEIAKEVAKKGIVEEKKLKKGEKAFEIILDNGEKISVVFEPDSFPGVNHFEFKTEGVNAISETGYLSSFINKEEMKNLSPEEAALKLGNALAKQEEIERPKREKQRKKLGLPKTEQQLAAEKKEKETKEEKFEIEIEAEKPEEVAKEEINVEKKSTELYGKTFDKLTRKQRLNVIKETKQPYFINDLAKAIKLFATPAFAKNQFEMKGEFLYDGLNKHIFTDTFQMIIKKEPADKILNDILEKTKKREIEKITKFDIPYAQAEKQINEKITQAREDYKGKFPDYEKIIPEVIGEEIVLVGITSDPVEMFVFNIGDKQLALNPDYLAHMVKNLPGAKITVVSPQEPIRFSENGKIVGLLMPIRLEKDILIEKPKTGKIKIYGKGTQNNGRDIAKGGLPNVAEMVQEKSADPGRPSKERGGEVAPRRHSERVSVIGERPATRVSNQEIEDLIKSKDTFSDEEKELLRQYTGAGGLERQGAEGRGLLDEYYTPKVAVKLVWDLVKEYTNVNKENINILEPSVGIGSFLEFTPKTASIEAFEINPISAKIASVLYPEAGIENAPFETLFVTDRGGKKTITPVYDITIGNPPYGEHRGKYKGLGEEPGISKYETYFIKRALDVTKEGGIVAFVLPSSILRGFQTLSGKKEIAKIGDLIDARRLPNSTFAYTDIGTDILVFKKSLAKNDFDISVRLAFLSNDSYFEQHKEKILGVEKERRGRFGIEKYVEGQLPEAQDFEKELPEDKKDIIVDEPIGDKFIEEDEQKVPLNVEDGNVELGEGMANVDEKTKKEANSKVVIVSDKKDKTISFNSGLTAKDIVLWKETTATGELTEKGIELASAEEKNLYGGKWFNNFNYFQGNIYEKMDQLEREKNKISNEQYQKQKRGLEEILPKPQTIENIIVLPTSDFAREMNFKDGETLIDKFKEYIKDLHYDAFESSSSWEITGYINGSSVTGSDKIMNMEIRRRRRKIGDKLMKKFLNEELNEAEKTEFEDKFNRSFNNYIRPDYTKVPLLAPINSTFKGKKLNVKPIQIEGAGFLTNKGLGLLAYDVGVGKTLTSILAINEVLKRGWAKKPLLIVPNGVYQKWIKEIKDLIPGVKINSLANLGGKFKGDLASLEIEDGSLSIVTYDGLTKLGFTEETYQELLLDLKDVMTGVNTTKRGEAKEEEKIAEAIGRAARETRGDRFFEDLGFDHITIDEVHNFKNIFSGAKVQERNNEFKSVRGSSSIRGIKAYIMAQYVLKKNNNRNVFGLSATPFSRSPLEIYSILSLFAKRKLEQLGIKNVNDFMTMFMKLEPKPQVKADRTVQVEDVIESFHNLQQMQKLISEYIDFRTGEEAGIKRPSKIKRTIILSPTATQLDYLDLAQGLYDDKDAGGAIVSITEQQNITLSPYLSRYNQKKPTYKEFVEDSPKIRFTMEAIKQIKKDNPKSNQIIYMPRGVEFYFLLKEYLIKELGYKTNEIGEIKGGMSADAKYNIQNQFNDPKHSLKILIGSETMKEGMDLHENTTELYHLFLPWNPTDILQVEGRLWRQGNVWKNVRVHYPLIENSVDQFLFQKLETKEKRIKNVWSYTGNEIEVGDINFEELKLDLITDPVMRVDAERKIVKATEQGRLETMKAELSFMTRVNKGVEETKSEIESVEKDLKEGKEGYWYEQAKKQLPKLKKKLIKAEEKLKGIDVVELNNRIKEKETEIKKQEEMVEKIDTDFENKRKEAENKRVEIIVKQNDYDLHVSEIANENKDFYTREIEQNRQDESIGSGAVGASIGAFAENTPIEFGGMDKIKPVEFPELVQLAKDLTGQTPSLKKFRRALGRFYSIQKGKIKLHPDLFKRENSSQLAKVFAHEIGHLIDYLPSQTLKRGHLLNRLLTLRKFMKEKYGDLKITNSQIRKELTTVSHYWRPMPEVASPSYLAYRKSSKELYADALSLLLNSPGTLERMAPTFYETFFQFLDEKPEVKSSYFELQAVLNGTRQTLIELRRTGVKKMFDEGDYKAAELQRLKNDEKKKRESNLLFKLKFELLEKSQAVRDKVAQLKKRGVHINDDENPVFFLEEKNYLGGKIKAILETKFQTIYDELAQKDISWNDFGEVLFYERILAGDRTELANPRGLTPEAVLESYNDLKKQMGENWPFVLQKMDEFRKRLKEVATEAYNAGLYTPELYERMQENPKYVTFQVIEHLENGMSSKVHHQVGTLKDITNPASASLLKMVETIKAIERNKVNRSIVELLKKNFSNEIKDAKVVYDGKGMRAVPSRHQYEEMLIVMEKGKAKGYYVDDYIQKSVSYNTIGQNSAVLGAIKLSNRAWFRPAFITFNMGFQSFNAIRDFLRFWKNTPKLSFFRAIKRYGQAARVAKIRAFGLPQNPTASDLEAQKIIQNLEYDQVFSIKFSDFILGEQVEDTQIQHLMSTFDIGLKEKRHIPAISSILNFIKNTGDLIETLPKVAGYYELRDGGKLTKEQKSFLRRKIGSPDFLAGGHLKPVTNELFLFSNAILQGIRSDIETAIDPQTRSGYWWKTAALNFLPKAIMYAILMGLMGDDYRKMMEEASEYDKTNYIVIPLGRTNGKTVYLRFPQDEMGRVLGGLFWKMLKITRSSQFALSDFTDIISYTGGQLPSLAPVFEVTGSSYQFLSGKNPYDTFRGESVLTDDEYRAGGLYALKPFLKWQWNQLGGGIFVRFSVHDGVPKEAGLGEKILSYPIVSNIAGRFIRISDFGRTEMFQKTIKGVQKEESRERLKERAIINKYIDQYQEADSKNEDIPKLIKEATKEVFKGQIKTVSEVKGFQKRFEISLIRGQSDANINALINKTIDEQMALLKQMKEQMDKEGFNEIFIFAQKHNIISKNTAQKFFEMQKK